MTLFSVTPGGLKRIDVPLNDHRNNLPVGTVLHWGGNIAWNAQDYAVIRRDPPSERFEFYGATYHLLSLETFKSVTVNGSSIQTAKDKPWHSQHFFLTDRQLTADEVLDLVENAKAREEADKRAAEEKGRARAAAIEKAKRDHPDLAQADGKTSDHARGAKNIRKELRKRFPGVTFRVRSESYSGGDSINVDWTDGPTREAVEKVTGKYQEGSFDGMQDLYEYNHDNFWPGIFGGAKYVFENRHLSEEALNAVAREQGYPEAKYDPRRGTFEGVDLDDSRRIVNAAYAKDLYKGGE